MPNFWPMIKLALPVLVCLAAWVGGIKLVAAVRKRWMQAG